MSDRRGTDGCNRSARTAGLKAIIRRVCRCDVPKNFEDILKDVYNEVRKIPNSWSTSAKSTGQQSPEIQQANAIENAKHAIEGLILLMEDLQDRLTMIERAGRG
jgi:hypothetical protein